MDNLRDIFVAAYRLGKGSFVYYSAGLCGLIILLRIGAVVFGVAIGLAAVLMAARLAGPTFFERLPPSAFILLVAYSGLFNDFRLSTLVVTAAIISTPLIAAIDNRRSNSLLLQTARVTKAWLPAGLAASSLTTLAVRNASSVGLFLVLVYFHDLGLKLCAGGGLQRRLAPLAALCGVLVLLWTSIQISVSPISPQQYWLFACVLGIAIPLGRLAMQLLIVRDGQRDLLHASHALAAPLWTAAVVVLAL